MAFQVSAEIHDTYVAQKCSYGNTCTIIFKKNIKIIGSWGALPQTP